MATLKDLAKRMKELAELIRVGISVSEFTNMHILLPHNLTIQVVKVILKTAIDLTPVDTGKAVSNWQVKLNGDINTNEIEAYFKGKSGTTRSECAKTAYKTASNVLQHWDKKTSIHVVNPVDYIRHINYGTSNKIGLFIVERAVAAGSAYLRAKSK